MIGRKILFLWIKISLNISVSGFIFMITHFKPLQAMKRGAAQDFTNYRSMQAELCLLV